MSTTITRCPLCWPDNVPRRPPHARTHAKFANGGAYTEATAVTYEINRLNGKFYSHQDPRVIISTNTKARTDGLPLGGAPEPADGGAAVYFTLDIRQGGKLIERPIVLTCDKWTKLGWNLSAIWRDIEAQRARLRWGCTNLQQAFRGYLAIPERAGGLSWWDTLKVKSTATKEEIQNAFKFLAKTHHPDKGGNPAEWAKITEALDQALSQVGS